MGTVDFPSLSLDGKILNKRKLKQKVKLPFKNRSGWLKNMKENSKQIWQIGNFDREWYFLKNKGIHGSIFFDQEYFEQMTAQEILENIELSKEKKMDFFWKFWKDVSKF